MEPLFEDLLGHNLSLSAAATAEHVVETAAQLPHASFMVRIHC